MVKTMVSCRFSPTNQSNDYGTKNGSEAQALQNVSRMKSRPLSDKALAPLQETDLLQSSNPKEMAPKHICVESHFTSLYHHHLVVQDLGRPMSRCDRKLLQLPPADGMARQQYASTASPYALRSKHFCKVLGSSNRTWHPFCRTLRRHTTTPQTCLKTLENDVPPTLKIKKSEAHAYAILCTMSYIYIQSKLHKKYAIYIYI